AAAALEGSKVPDTFDGTSGLSSASALAGSKVLGSKVPDTFDGASASSAAALAGSKVSDTFDVASASSAGAVSPGAETASDVAAAGMTGSSGARRVPGTGVGPRPGASVASDTSSAETSSGSGSARAAGSGWKGVGGWTRAGPAGGAHASR